MPSDRENRLGIFARAYTDDQLRTMGFNDVGLRDEAVIIGEPSTWGELQSTSVMDDLRAAAEALHPSDAENARRIAEASASDRNHATLSAGPRPPGYNTDCSCTACVGWRRDMVAALPHHEYVFNVGDHYERPSLTEEQVRLARRRMEVDYVELAPRRDTIAMVGARERRLSTPVAADWQPNAWEA